MQLSVNSELMRQKGRMKRTANVCVTDETRLLLACAVVIFAYYYWALFLNRNICLKEGEAFSKIIIVTLVTQGLRFSYLCCLLV